MSQDTHPDRWYNEDMVKNSFLILFICISLLLSFLLFKQNRTLLSQQNEQSKTVTLEDTDIVEDSNSELSESAVENRNILDISGQGLEKLPPYVLSETNIEKLDISDNNLTGALPAEIRQLQNLKVLDASNNKMTGVPAEIGQLAKLEILDMSNNRLTGLPYELGNLKNLKVLNLSGNDYSEQDLERIKEGLPSSTEIIL